MVAGGQAEGDDKPDVEEERDGEDGRPNRKDSPAASVTTKAASTMRWAANKQKRSLLKLLDAANWRGETGSAAVAKLVRDPWS